MVPAGTESLTDLLNRFESKSTVFLCLSLFVLIAEIIEVFFKDYMEMVSPVWYIIRVVRDRSRSGECCHNDKYCGDGFPASTVMRQK